MTELIVIRHGETDWNRQHRFQGQIDVPLNATGLAQAERLAERLADEPIDVLVASDLQRAHSTALALSRRRRAQAVHVEPLWREQSFGVLEGLDVPTIRSQHAPLWDRYVRHEADYALPGGESNQHFSARVLRALQATLAAHAGARIAVVTHGGVLDMLWRAARKLPLHGPRDCEIPNTGINRLRWADEQLHILSWAEAGHLGGLPEQPSTVPAPR
jgi:probable phosphoglycerate mutase